MNRGVIFFIVIVLVILAVIFIPKNKDNTAPADETMNSETSINLQGSAIEAVGEGSADTTFELAPAGEVVEVEVTTEAGAEVAQ